MALKTNKVKKKTCVECKRNLEIERNFFNVNGDDDIVFQDGKIPICKDCVKAFLENPDSGYKHFIRLLMLVNRPFDEALFKQVEGNYYNYLSKVTYKHYKGAFTDSDGFFRSAAPINEDTVERLSPEELRECQLYWGSGEYTEDDYIYLISRYYSYCNTYDVDTPTFENIIQQICQLELDIRKKRVKATDNTKETKLILELMRSAGIAPSQEKESKNNEKNTFGVWVKTWENTRPVPKPLPEFEDVDGIQKYMRNNFLSPMQKSLDLELNHPEEYEEHVAKHGISKEDLLGIKEGDL